MSRLALAVVGTSRPRQGDARFVELARQLGRSLPAAEVLVQTGACGGFPDALADGFRENGGRVVGYSPGADLAGHRASGSPEGSYDELLFGFGGLIEREVALIGRSAGVLALGGNVGTLSELCMAVKMQRPLLIVPGFPGISPRFVDLLAELDVYPEPCVRLVEPEQLPAAVRELSSASPRGEAGRSP